MKYHNLSCISYLSVWQTTIKVSVYYPTLCCFSKCWFLSNCMETIHFNQTCTAIKNKYPLWTSLLAAIECVENLHAHSSPLMRRNQKTSRKKKVEPVFPSSLKIKCKLNWSHHSLSQRNLNFWALVWIRQVSRKYDFLNVNLFKYIKWNPEVLAQVLRLQTMSLVSIGRKPPAQP